MKNNPDVQNAVNIGQFNSGFEHFEKFGKDENRYYLGEKTKYIFKKIKFLKKLDFLILTLMKKNI